MDDNEELNGGTCAECGQPLELVRPGKWQCPKAPHDGTEVLPVSPELMALFDRKLGPIPEPRRPDEFTAPELAQARNYTLTRATVVLHELMAAGKATRRRGVPSNNYWYRFVE